jgi:hypothetical protein
MKKTKIFLEIFTYTFTFFLCWGVLGAFIYLASISTSSTCADINNVDSGKTLKDLHNDACGFTLEWAFNENYPLVNFTGYSAVPLKQVCKKNGLYYKPNGDVDEITNWVKSMGSETYVK